VVSAPVDWLPVIALAPDHAPEAVQEFAFAEDQVRFEVPPLATELGFAASDTVGAVGAVGAAAGVELTVPPPQAESTEASTGTSSMAIARNIGILIC